MPDLQGSKADWFGEIRSLVVKHSNILLLFILSNIFPNIESYETGL